MINNSNHPYLCLINLSSEKTIEAQIVIALQMAMEDSDPVTQDEVYTFLDDEVGEYWGDEEIHWFLTEHHGVIHKYESTDEFFRNMRCDSPFDDDAHHLPWMRAMMDSHMDY